MSKYLEWLEEVKKDEGQHEALSRSGHCVVVAGPGTGKTRTLVLKAAKLLYEEVFQPRGIACVTYAHAMAEELRRQLEDLGISYESHNIFIGTLHSFCFSNILMPFGRIYGIPVPDPLRFASDKQQAKIYAGIWKNLNNRQQNILPIPVRDKTTGELLSRLPIEFQKYRRTHLNERDVENKNQYLDEVIEAYEGALLESKAVDFDLAMKWSVQLVEKQDFIRRSLEAKFPWLLVDEYQDLGLALHRIVKALTSQTDLKLFAIGDPNQCIYDFTGASPDYFLELERAVDFYGQPIRLNINYRSCPEIINGAKNIPPKPIEQKCNRAGESGIFRTFKSNKQLDVIVNTIKKLEESKGIAYQDILILGRDNPTCKSIVNAIKKSNPDLPISKSAGQIYDSRKPLLEWIENLAQYSVGLNNILFNDLLSFWVKLHTAYNESGNDALSFANRLRLFNALEEGKKYSDSAMKWLASIATSIRLEDKLAIYELERPDDIDEFIKLKSALDSDGEWHSFNLHQYASIVTKTNQLSVETIHSSKGQQRKAVILARAELLNTGFPDQQVASQRLMYVGMTRAKDILLILHDGSSHFVRNVLERE